MKIAIGCDHGGINLKEAVLCAVKDTGNVAVDFGTTGTDSVDYPVFAKLVADAVRDGDCPLGILLCGTGIGMSIAANKVKGIRCGHVTDTVSAALTRQHNDANVIAMGGRITTAADAYEIAKAFLTAEFQGGRHEKRVEMIRKLEQD